MAEAKVIFTLNGKDLTIQCIIDDKMRYICEKYLTKIKKEINSLLFLYGEEQVNFESKFKEQANDHDLKENKMNIFVYEIKSLIVQKQKLDEILLSNDEIMDNIDGIKFQIGNIIKISTDDSIKSQLKYINKRLNKINENINDNNEKINNLSSNYNNKNNNTKNNNNKINNNKNNNKNLIENIGSNDMYKKIFFYANEKKN